MKLVQEVKQNEVLKKNIIAINDDYILNGGKNLELQEDASRIAEDFGIKTPKTYGRLVGNIMKEANLV